MTLKLVGCILIYFSGFVTALNLATMYPSISYESSWERTICAAIVSIFGFVLIERGEK